MFIPVYKNTILHPQYLLQVLEKTIWQVTHFIALHEPANLNVLSVKGNRERPKEFPHVNYKITIIIAHVMDITGFFFLCSLIGSSNYLYPLLLI